MHIAIGIIESRAGVYRRHRNLFRSVLLPAICILLASTVSSSLQKAQRARTEWRGRKAPVRIHSPLSAPCPCRSVFARYRGRLRVSPAVQPRQAPPPPPPPPPLHRSRSCRALDIALRRQLSCPPHPTPAPPSACAAEPARTAVRRAGRRVAASPATPSRAGRSPIISTVLTRAGSEFSPQTEIRVPRSVQVKFRL